MCLTVEEVLLALQHLADLQDPDLADARVAGVELQGLRTAGGPPRGQGEPTGVPLLVLLQAQTAHLHRASHHTTLQQYFYILDKYEPKSLEYGPTRV